TRSTRSWPPDGSTSRAWPLAGDADVYLLDTNALSEILRKRPDPAFLTRLRAIPAESLHTSSICVFELRLGAALRGGRLWERVEADVLPRVRVLPLGRDEAIRAGEVWAGLQRAGQPIGLEDVLIAATALVRDLTVVTGNVRHFDRVPGIRVANWLAG
ncbi:MAG: PIN domain-containing protein, partial [Myxococcota bacterium]